MNIIISPFQETLFRFRPDSTLSRSESAYFIPDGISKMDIAPVLCIKMHRAGKAIQPEFAARYLDSFIYGIVLYPHLADFHGLNREFAENGMDDTTIIPLHTISIEELEESLKATHFEILINGISPYKSLANPSLKNILEKISEISGYSSVRIGDYLLFELDRKHEVKAGEHITAYMDQEKIIDLQIR